MRSCSASLASRREEPVPLLCSCDVCVVVCCGLPIQTLPRISQAVGVARREKVGLCHGPQRNKFPKNFAPERQGLQNVQKLSAAHATRTKKRFWGETLRAALPSQEKLSVSRLSFSGTALRFARRTRAPVGMRKAGAAAAKRNCQRELVVGCLGSEVLAEVAAQTPHRARRVDAQNCKKCAESAAVN